MHRNNYNTANTSNINTTLYNDHIYNESQPVPLPVLINNQNYIDRSYYLTNQMAKYSNTLNTDSIQAANRTSIRTNPIRNSWQITPLSTVANNKNDTNFIYLKNQKLIHSPNKLNIDSTTMSKHTSLHNTHIRNRQQIIPYTALMHDKNSIKPQNIKLCHTQNISLPPIIVSPPTVVETSQCSCLYNKLLFIKSGCQKFTLCFLNKIKKIKETILCINPDTDISNEINITPLPQNSVCRINDSCCNNFASNNNNALSTSRCITNFEQNGESSNQCLLLCNSFGESSEIVHRKNTKKLCQSTGSISTTETKSTHQLNESFTTSAYDDQDNNEQTAYINNNLLINRIANFISSCTLTCKSMPNTASNNATVTSKETLAHTSSFSMMLRNH